MHQKLPVGADIFVNLRKQDFYYIDKTNFIRDLLQNRGTVNLFTRPRRFGKTLNMTMLQAFFEIGADHRDIFAGLDIMKEQALCEQYMNRNPVIFLTLKSVEGANFADALERVGVQVANECLRLAFLGRSQHMEPEVLNTFAALKARTATQQHLASSLKILSRMLEAHYGQKAILLIDEYDVPLDRAFHNGYYGEMSSFMRVFLGEAFKTNASMEFAAVTGCLRISKESIFTGVNNLKIDTITDDRYDEYFG
ncbi:MAG: AAA family ATPase, partial [Clostridiales bacterium]|nr:AAA family ATPase [Clostridiales bacterium]